MPIIQLSTLTQLDFQRAQAIRLVDGRLRFVPLPDTAKLPAVPSVYLWIAIRAGEAQQGDPLYVGKAGRGVAARAGQHRGGFTSSATGRQNAAALMAVLAEEGMTVEVFARVSGTIECFGQVVSAVAIEEEALIQRLQPRLNRAAPPRAHRGRP
jgi:hypothetical protein